MGIKPLTGIKVLELTTYVAAPICGRMLADLGAEVIKVESPRGDAWRGLGRTMGVGTTEHENPMFDIYNSRKRSIVLDLKNQKGTETLFRFLNDTDVFLTNTRPKALKRLGINQEVLLARFPKLIYATITGFGEHGPEANSPGFDTVAFWTKTGFLRDTVIQTDNGFPANSPSAAGDCISGITLLSSILAALLQRERTGQGDYVTVSLYNTGIWVMNSMILRAQERYGEVFPKQRSQCWPLDTCYLCADGEWIRVVINEFDRYAPVFFEVLGYPRLLEDPRFCTNEERRKNRGEMLSLFEASFRTKTSGEWLRLLKEQDIVCDRMYHFKDVSNCDQAWANDYLEEFVFPNGDHCILPCSPIRLRSQGVFRSDRGPYLGEHTEELLQSLGYGRQEIESLSNSGAVGIPESQIQHDK